MKQISNNNTEISPNDLKKGLTLDRNCGEALSKKIDSTAKLDKNELARNQSYGEIVPSKFELNCDAPLIPYQYQKNFNINKISNQDGLSTTEHFSYAFSLMGMEENSSYMRIFPPPHIIL